MQGHGLCSIQIGEDVSLVPQGNDDDDDCSVLGQKGKEGGRKEGRKEAAMGGSGIVGQSEEPARKKQLFGKIALAVKAPPGLLTQGQPKDPFQGPDCCALSPSSHRDCMAQSPVARIGSCAGILSHSKEGNISRPQRETESEKRETERGES